MIALEHVAGQVSPEVEQVVKDAKYIWHEWPEVRPEDVPVLLKMAYEHEWLRQNPKE